MTLNDFRTRWTGHEPEIQDVKQQYAVLVPLVEGPEGPSLLFEVRASTLAHQPGEVCFPGGRVEPGESPRTAPCGRPLRSWPSRLVRWS